MSKEYFKKYYKTNKENMREYNKAYYNKHKKKGEEIVNCKICGTEIMTASLYCHIKSKFHNSFLNSSEMEHRNISDCI